MTKSDDPTPPTDYNIIRMIKDGTPNKLKALAKEHADLQERMLEIETESATLNKVCEIVGITANPLVVTLQNSEAVKELADLAREMLFMIDDDGVSFRRVEAVIEKLNL